MHSGWGAWARTTAALLSRKRCAIMKVLMPFLQNGSTSGIYRQKARGLAQACMHACMRGATCGTIVVPHVAAHPPQPLLPRSPAVAAGQTVHQRRRWSREQLMFDGLEVSPSELGRRPCMWWWPRCRSRRTPCTTALTRCAARPQTCRVCVDGNMQPCEHLSPACGLPCRPVRSPTHIEIWLLCVADGALMACLACRS